MSDQLKEKGYAVVSEKDAEKIIQSQGVAMLEKRKQDAYRAFIGQKWIDVYCAAVTDGKLPSECAHYADHCIELFKEQFPLQ